MVRLCKRLYCIRILVVGFVIFEVIVIYKAVTHSYHWFEHIKKQVINDTLIKLKNMGMGEDLFDTDNDVFNDASSRLNKDMKYSSFLVIGVLSKLENIEKRDVIRKSWFKDCYDNPDKVVCRFFTDPISNSNDTKYQEEKDTNRDIINLPFKNGSYSFGMRLIWMLLFFMKNFRFDFFLRIDDDYFLCLDRLIKELPFRPKHGLCWGYLHCKRHVVRIDKSFVLLSRDVIKESLDRLNSTLLCHSFEDQMLALWLQDSKLKLTIFADNLRLIEAESRDKDEYFVPNVCQKYIGLHGLETREFEKFWGYETAFRTMRDENSYEILKITKVESVCEYPRTFDYQYMSSHYRDKPIPCKYRPKFREHSNNLVSRRRYNLQLYLV